MNEILLAVRAPMLSPKTQHFRGYGDKSVFMAAAKRMRPWTDAVVRVTITLT